MRKILTSHLLIVLGWVSVAFGLIGTVLPVLPTTPFLILALLLFSKSSSRFHQMLLNNAWFGPGLRQWEENRSMARQAKYKACFLIIVTFSISLAIIDKNIHLQVFLVILAVVLLFFIWRIRETPLVKKYLEPGADEGQQEVQNGAVEINIKETLIKSEFPVAQGCAANFNCHKQLIL